MRSLPPSLPPCRKSGRESDEFCFSSPCTFLKESVSQKQNIQGGARQKAWSQAESLSVRKHVSAHPRLPFTNKCHLSVDAALRKGIREVEE